MLLSRPRSSAHHFAAIAFLPLTALSALACGSEEPNATPEEPKPVERLQENDARTDPGAPCTTGMPSVTQFCALPFEEPSVEIVDQGSATRDGCTALYLATRVAESSRVRIRRYHLTGVDVCGFARDEGFGELTGTLSQIAVARTSEIFSLGYRVVRRIHPGPPIDCAAGDVALGDNAMLTIAPDGTRGYVAWDTTTETPKFATIRASANGCELAPLSLPDNLFGWDESLESIAADVQGRLHVAIHRSSVGFAPVYVFDADGQPVDAYDPRGEIALSRSPLVPCGEGMCIDLFERGGIAKFTPEGRFVATTPFAPFGSSFSRIAYTGSFGGPVFRVGTGAPPHPGARVQIVSTP